MELPKLNYEGLADGLVKATRKSLADRKSAPAPVAEKKAEVREADPGAADEVSVEEMVQE